jgi:hypothetical protein
MFRVTEFGGNECLTPTFNHQIFRKTGISMVAIGLCLLMLDGCVPLKPAEPAQTRNVSIDSFLVAKTNPDSVEIELTGSNDGSMGQLCLGAISKSRDGIVRSIGYPPYMFPMGQQVRITAKVMSPPGSQQSHTDTLVVIVYQCGKEVILSRKFDWPYIWPVRSANLSSDNTEELADPNPWQIFFQNLNELDFASLDALTEKWNNPKERDKNGEWKLDSFRSALNYPARNKDWHGGLERIQQWRKYNQGSPGAAIAEAKYWVGYAWHIRGYDDNSEVDPVAMRVFHERMKRAEQVLDDSKAFASNNPLWYETYLEILVDEKRDDKSIESIFNDGILKHPYFQPLYVDMAKRWSPWSGENSDWHKVDEVVNRAVTVTGDIDGGTNYARLYAQINDQQKVEFDLFQDSQASWPRMRSSFEELVKRYPSDDNLNTFAVFACRAGDKTAYLGIRPRIQGHIVSGKWPSNYSIDLCDHRFMQYS